MVGSTAIMQYYLSIYMYMYMYIYIYSYLSLTLTILIYIYIAGYYCSCNNTSYTRVLCIDMQVTQVT